MSDPKFTYTVQFKGTGKKLDHIDEPIKPGRHGRFDTREDAEVGVSQCKAWFNRRCIQQREENEYGVETRPAKYLDGECVVVWIDEWIHEWDDGKERFKLPKLFKSGEPTCAGSSVKSESEENESEDTTSTESSSARKGGTRRSRTSELATAAD